MSTVVKLITRAYRHPVGAAYYAVVLRKLSGGTYTTEASCGHRHRTPAGALDCGKRMSSRARRRLRAQTTEARS